MKHNSSNRRSRSRGNKQRHSGGRNNYESNGPSGKVRGTVQQVLDKYLALARDAQSSGDRIGAESFFQFAEHYFRVLNVDGGNGQTRRDRASVAPGDLSVPIVEGNTLGSNSEDLQDDARENADMTEGSAIDSADQPQPEIATDMEVPSGGEQEDSSEPNVMRSRRKEPEGPPEEVEASTVS